jgi:predicted nuclease of predicted toxin-antitoxin system
MGLRFFADHCVPNSVIQGLFDAGHEVIRLKDHIPIESPDLIVIAAAQELDSILISLNGDFTDRLNYPPGNYKGIVALQVRNHPEIIPQLMLRLKGYLSSYPDTKSYKGKLVLVEANRIRIR